MNDVYEVIEALRKYKGLTAKKLAEKAGMPATTLATIMRRQPITIAKKHLTAIANALGVQWYDLLNVSESAYPDDEKVSSKLSPSDTEAVLVKLTGEDKYASVRYSVTGRGTPPQESLDSTTKNGVRIYGSPGASDPSYHYRHSIILMLNRLNTEGLIEAMHQVTAIARNPNLCKKPAKEDTLWQNEEPQMVAEQSNNERMVDGKDSIQQALTPEQES